MISNPATFFVNGNDEEVFTYEGGSINSTVSNGLLMTLYTFDFPGCYRAGGER